MEKRSVSEWIKRYVYLCFGLMSMAFGVAFSIKADLGTSPISSFPYVLSLIVPLSVGNATILMHCVFILIQILILRKEFPLIQLMQLPIAFVFGYLTDFGVWAINEVQYDAYWQQCLFCMAGIVLVAAGVSFEVTAKAVTLAGEGVVLALNHIFPVKFSSLKIGFDVTLVVIAGATSWLFLGRIEGIREGTVAAALLVGLTSRPITWLLKRFEKRFLCQSSHGRMR